MSGQSVYVVLLICIMYVLDFQIIIHFYFKLKNDQSDINTFVIVLADWIIDRPK